MGDEEVERGRPRVETLKAPRVETLSERELEVLRLISEGFSNREIGERLFLSPDTIKWYNRQIFGKLGVHSRTQAVALAGEHELLEPSGGELPKQDVAVDDLPSPLSSFVGRQSQLAEVEHLLGEFRLVTLIGPGGTGKTRLALEAARGRARDYTDGAAFIDLAPVRQADQVAEALQDTLRVGKIADQTPERALVQFLRKRNFLLVIDNFEQVVGAAPLLNTLLHGAPSLSILVTSREPLRLSSEILYEVPPLSLPNLEARAQALAEHPSEAMTLFVQRARASNSAFALNAQNAPAVAEICRRLDGLPLAIELAAARVRLYQLEVLLAQIKKEPMALKNVYQDMPARQDTLWSAMAWSYDLLPEAEKRLFARIAVFQGGRTIDAVKHVCSSDLSIDVLDGLESLVDKSMLGITEGPSSEPRFVFLETVHAFASEMLKQSGEAGAMSHRHASYFADLVRQAAPHLRGGSRQTAWLTVLEAEHANLQVALTWAFNEGDLGMGMGLVSGLGHFWLRQGHWEQGSHWIGLAMQHVEDFPEEVQAAVYYSAGVLFLFTERRGWSQEMFGKAAALYRPLGASVDLGWTLILHAADSIGFIDEYDEALSDCEQGMVLLREAEDLAGVSQALNVIGEMSRAAGIPERAKSAYTEALEIARRQGDQLRQAMNMCNLAFLALDEKDANSARQLMLEGLRLYAEMGNRLFTISALAGVSGSLAAFEEFEAAAQLLGAADELFERYRLRPQTADSEAFEDYRTTVRAGMSNESFMAAYRKGQSMGLDEAVAFALTFRKD